MPKRPSRKERRALLSLFREIRLEADLRQVDLARKLGNAQSFVSRYESGERRLDILELRSLCRVVGISPAEFFRRFEKKLNEA